MIDSSPIPADQSQTRDGRRDQGIYFRARQPRTENMTQLKINHQWPIACQFNRDQYAASACSQKARTSFMSQPRSLEYAAGSSRDMSYKLWKPCILSPRWCSHQALVQLRSACHYLRHIRLAPIGQLIGIVG